MTFEGTVMMTSDSAKMADNLAQLFSILGDGTRMRILFLLKDAEVTVQSLADELEMTHSAVSHHLRLFRPYQLVKSRKEGRNVFYSLYDDCVWNLLEAGVSHLQHENCEFTVKQ
jgi:DNA-binding transcriptional ArsR family regulator